LIFLYVAIASSVSVLAHRTPGYGVETDLLTDFAPAAQALLAGRMEAPFYIFHGFGYPLLLAAFSIPVGGDFFLAAKLLNLSSAAAGLWFAYALFRNFGGRTMGLFVLMGLAVNPSFWTYAIEVGTDMPAFALLMGATYGALTGRSVPVLAAAGLAAGFAYVTRYNAISVLVASAIVLLARRNFRFAAVYLAGAAVPIGAWLIANTAVSGHPFFNRNYLNIAFAVYGRQTQWEQFWTSVGTQFHSLGDVFRHDPVAFVRGIGANLGSHWLSDARELLPLWLGIPAVLGVALLWARRPGWRGMAVHFVIAYLVLGVVFYNVRFFLYLLPFYLAGAATILLPPRAEKGGARFDFLSRLPHAGRPELGWSVAVLLFALSAWKADAVVRAELAKDPLDVRLAGETLRRLGPKNAIVMTRKPHVAFYAGMRQLRFPSQGSFRALLRGAWEAHASYVLYSGMEASLRPDLLLLMEPEVSLPGFRQIDRQIVDGSNYFTIYEVSREPVDSVTLDSALVAALERFQAAHPKEPVAHYDVGSHLLDMGRAREALEQILIAERLQPDMVRAAMLETEARRQLGEFDAARAAARRSKAIGGSELFMETALGQIDLAARKYEDARSHLSRAVAIDPTNVATLRSLADARAGLGDSAGARATLARIATLSKAQP
jgi:tetratricopeptide (TPR) repeat protein